MQILNTGSHTFFSNAHKTFSCIDVLLTSANIPDRFQWEVLDDLHGSDHFPIMINIATSKVERTKRPKWILKNADWPNFSSNVTSDFYTRAALNRTIDEQAKKKSWESFIPSISISTPLSTVFNKIQRISGVSRNIQPPIIISNYSFLIHMKLLCKLVKVFKTKVYLSTIPINSKPICTDIRLSKLPLKKT